MRIGFDARIVSYSQAGLAQYVLRLLEALAKVAGPEEFLLLEGRPGAKALKEVVGERGNFRLRQLWTPCHHPWEQWTLPLEVGLLHLDVLHSPDFIPPLRRNCASVITVHDLAFLLYPHFLTPQSARYYGQIDRAVASTDHIIAVSASTKADLIRLLGVPEEKISVIYEAAHPLFRPLEEGERDVLRSIRNKYGLEGDFLLFVSTIEPRKNLPALLRAFARLRGSLRRRLQLAVAGDRGWLFQEVEETLQAERLADEVVFCGPVEREELLYLYNAAKALVYPSFYEGFGLPPLEAMACGTPVVAAKVSSIPEVVGDAALLVEPQDVEGLANALWRVLQDEVLQQELRHKGLERAKHFSWDNAARQTLQVYRRAVEGR